MKKTIIGLSIIAILLFSACGSSNGPVASLTIIGASGNAVNLNGRWRDNCFAGEVAEQFTVTFSGSSISGTGSVFYPGIDCTGAAGATISFAGSFMLGGEVTVDLNGTPVIAVETDVTLTSAQMTLNNAAMVDLSNTASVCGFTDWVVGVAKNVLDKDCFISTISSSFKDVTYINDLVTPNEMYGGDGTSIPDANGYPTVLDQLPDLRL